MTVWQKGWKSSVLWSVHHGTLNRTCSRFIYLPKFNYYLYEHHKLQHKQNCSYTIQTFHLEFTNNMVMKWNVIQRSNEDTIHNRVFQHPQCILVYLFYCYLIPESKEEDVRRERGSNLWQDGKLKTCIEQSWSIYIQYQLRHYCIASYLCYRNTSPIGRAPYKWRRL